MKSHAADLIFAALLLLAIYRGYKAGLLATLFAVVGYVGGGLAALYYAVDFIKHWQNSAQKYALIIVAVIIGASIAQSIFRRIGRFVHTKVLFAPFTWVDSLLGALLSAIRTALFIYLFALLSLAMPWSWAHQYIPQSQIYQQMEKSAPGVLKSVTEQIANLRSSPIANPLG
jgi:membrane protein required for colicin V production